MFYVESGLGTRFHCHQSPIKKAARETHKDELYDNEGGLIKDITDGQAHMLIFKTLPSTKQQKGRDLEPIQILTISRNKNLVY